MLTSPLVAIMLLTATSDAPGPMTFEAVYRLPYADGTQVSVFDDAESHRPLTRIDLDLQQDVDLAVAHKRFAGEIDKLTVLRARQDAADVVVDMETLFAEADES